MIVTAPDKADGTMRECAELGTKHVWMHQSYGQGRYPLMFKPIADFGHEDMRVIYRGHVLTTV